MSPQLLICLSMTMPRVLSCQGSTKAGTESCFRVTPRESASWVWLASSPIPVWNRPDHEGFDNNRQPLFNTDLSGEHTHCRR